MADFSPVEADLDDEDAFLDHAERVRLSILGADSLGALADAVTGRPGSLTVQACGDALTRFHALLLRAEQAAALDDDRHSPAGLEVAAERALGRIAPVVLGRVLVDIIAAAGPAAPSAKPNLRAVAAAPRLLVRLHRLSVESHPLAAALRRAVAAAAADGSAPALLGAAGETAGSAVTSGCGFALDPAASAAARGFEALLVGAADAARRRQGMRRAAVSRLLCERRRAVSGDEAARGREAIRECVVSDAESLAVWRRGDDGGGNGGGEAAPGGGAATPVAAAPVAGGGWGMPAPPAVSRAARHDAGRRIGRRQSRKERAEEAEAGRVRGPWGSAAAYSARGALQAAYGTGPELCRWGGGSARPNLSSAGAASVVWAGLREAAAGDDDGAAGATAAFASGAAALLREWSAARAAGGGGRGPARGLARQGGQRQLRGEPGGEVRVPVAGGRRGRRRRCRRVAARRGAGGPPPGRGALGRRSR